jgi:hypothetical protein
LQEQQQPSNSNTKQQQHTAVAAAQQQQRSAALLQEQQSSVQFWQRLPATAVFYSPLSNSSTKQLPEYQVWQISGAVQQSWERGFCALAVCRMTLTHTEAAGVRGIGVKHAAATGACCFLTQATRATTTAAGITLTARAQVVAVAMHHLRAGLHAMLGWGS